MQSLSQIKGNLKKSNALKVIYGKIRSWFIASLITVSPVFFTKCRFRLIMGKWPNLKNPQTFDEKLLWLNLYWRHPLKAQCGDKYTMRTYVKELGLENILPQLFGVYSKSEEIDLDILPNRFVLKCTHGCGFNIVCKHKDRLDIEASKRQLDKWMQENFAKRYGELHYAAMKPRIICEEYLEDLSSDLPSDYKIFCFDGRVHCTMACTERMLNGRAKYDIYDLAWEAKLPYSKTSLLANRKIPKPAAYEEMINAAEKLSEPFPFVRIDFYSIKGKAVIGEMTFSPAGCIDVNITDFGQSILGGLIKLPEKRLL